MLYLLSFVLFNPDAAGANLHEFLTGCFETLVFVHENFVNLLGLIEGTHQADPEVAACCQALLIFFEGEEDQDCGAKAPPQYRSVDSVLKILQVYKLQELFTSLATPLPPLYLHLK